MKLLAVAAALLVASPLCAVDSSGPVNVHIVNESDLKDLARGYAQAYANLSRAVTLVIQRDGHKQTLTGVRSMRAQDGVLIVEVGRGALYLINPRDVLFVSDDTAAPAATAN